VYSPQSYVQVTICPRFPHSALCSSEEVYNFALHTRYRDGHFISRENLHRVPDGVAGQIPERAYAGAAYEEINRFGLLFARTLFHKLPWDGQRDVVVLSYGDLFHSLCKLLLRGKSLSRYGLSRHRFGPSVAAQCGRGADDFLSPTRNVGRRRIAKRLPLYS
jgi:hypothetical protein